MKGFRADKAAQVRIHLTLAFKTCIINEIHREE